MLTCSFQPEREHTHKQIKTPQAQILYNPGGYSTGFVMRKGTQLLNILMTLNPAEKATALFVF